MLAFLRSTLLRLLLLSVVLNLGDAPYVDELIEEMSQASTTSVQIAASGDQAQDPHAQVVTKSYSSIYDELLANVPMPQQEAQPVSLAKLSGEKPETVAPRPSCPPLSSIDKPPRYELAA
ncbi:MAG: hypothetical protein KGN32_15520 [Burkholderiales bacterium]|nr:hypothetical protein [Burkholderiales bacterium]